MQPVNLAIVDDHALFRKTLKDFLSEQKNLRVVIQASDMSDLLHKLKGFAVDILLMDLYMPGLNGNEAVKTVRSEYSAIKILVISMNSDTGVISDLLDCGIHGYLSKSEEPEELLKAIDTVADNRLYRNRLFTEALYFNKQNTIKSFAEPFTSLNDREKRILQMIWEEKSNKEMADELFLGVRSIEKIRQDIKEKLGVKSTVGLLKYAIKKRLVSTAMHVS